jgi:hypothetical protein
VRNTEETKTTKPNQINPMKNKTKDDVHKALIELIAIGKAVIGKICVNDGKKITHYTTLSECPPEHREGYRRALETCRDVYIQDVVYDPVFFAKEHAKTIATLE